ncbi:44866_t:CDS:2 [Gigaspora margarita]|uniref:44866_t:CDS:1 n=1 Tax=Gigaspora margarita TaxID=4874 RepID=A0ABN7VNF3_GIGMA|nr:44866_t:CDS:2 [Gigaspora margarita]
MDPTIKYVEFLAASQNSNKKSGDIASSFQNTDMISLINTEPKQITAEQELYGALGAEPASVLQEMLQHQHQDLIQQLDELPDLEDGMKIDLILREALVNIILEEDNSKNNTENQWKLYSRAITRPREP